MVAPKDDFFYGFLKPWLGECPWVTGEGLGILGEKAPHLTSTSRFQGTGCFSAKGPSGADTAAC